MHYREELTKEVRSNLIRYKPSPLIQGGLEIAIEVTVKWEDRNAMDVLHKKVEEVRLEITIVTLTNHFKINIK